MLAALCLKTIPRPEKFEKNYTNSIPKARGFVKEAARYSLVPD
jgi:hypothetical protein